VAVAQDEAESACCAGQGLVCACGAIETSRTETLLRTAGAPVTEVACRTFTYTAQQK